MGAVTKIPSDGALIAGLAQLEGLAALLYARAVYSQRLRGDALALARIVLEHEQAHARALTRELRTLGVPAPQLPSSARALERALKPHHVSLDFSRSRSERDWLKLLAGLEASLERNYHQAIAGLRRAALLTLCAEILGSEAQHSALLGSLLSPRNVDKAAPDAFINGD